MSDKNREDEEQSLLIAGHERIQIPAVLPVLPVRDVVVFPGVTVPLSIGRPKSLAALERAGEGGFIIVPTQRDPATEDPSAEELFPVACIVRVLRVIDSRAGGKQAIVVGVARTRTGAPVDLAPAMTMRLDPLMDLETDPAEIDELWGRVAALAEKVDIR